MRALHIPKLLGRGRVVVALGGVVLLVLGASSASAAPSNTADAKGFHTIAPTRVLDTRYGTGGNLSSPLKAGTPYAFKVVIADPYSIPDDATALVINVTVTNGTTASNLKVYGGNSVPAVAKPKGIAPITVPSTSTMNWTAMGPTAAIANGATVGIGTDHDLTLLNDSGTVNVIVDVVGYYANTDAAGPMGPEGPAGAEGPQGPPGADGTTAGPVGSVYLQATNSTAETVKRGTGNLVTFDKKGTALGGINFNRGEGSFTVVDAGVYKVSFSILADQPNQFNVQVNGAAPTEGAMVFGAAANEPNVGTAVLTLAAGDVITLENLTSTGAEVGDAPLALGDVVLTVKAGGTATTVNASIVIEELNN